MQDHWSARSILLGFAFTRRQRPACSRFLILSWIWQTCLFVEGPGWVASFSPSLRAIVEHLYPLIPWILQTLPNGPVGRRLDEMQQRPTQPEATIDTKDSRECLRFLISNWLFN